MRFVIWYKSFFNIFVFNIEIPDNAFWWVLRIRMRMSQNSGDADTFFFPVKVDVLDGDIRVKGAILFIKTQ